jgi:hypothetical protein
MLTASEIFHEYGKCLQDPAYAIETYLETFDKTQEGFVPFKLFPRQKQIIESYKGFRFNIVTKPRQAGVSTTTAAYESIIVAFADTDNPEAILILANKQDMAQEFLAKIKDFLGQLPRWVWGGEYYGNEKKEAKSIFITDSKKEIKLPNGSRVKAVATSKDALRGYTPTCLIMDEAAFIDKGDIVFGAALTALGTGGRATLISTPNGMDALYYKTYEQAKSGDNDFNVIEMKWYEDLRYNKDLRWLKEDEVIEEVEFTFESYDKMIRDGYKPTSGWYEDMCRGMNNDARMIAQELDVSFIGSGGNVIDEDYIEYQEKHNVMDPKWVSGPEKEFWMWVKPIEGHEYVAGVDVSRGDGADWSTIVIVDITTMEQVFEYRGKTQPDLLAQLVEEYCGMYEAYTIVDITGGMGVPTVLKLLEIEFPNIHYDKPRSNVLARKRELDNFAKDDKIPGFNVGSNRLPMVAHFEYMIRTNGIKVRSRRLTSEMKTFVYKNGRPDHMDTYNDDLLMALAMPLWVVEHSFKNLKKLEKKTKAILSSWSVGGNSSTPDETKRGSGFVPKNERNKKQLTKPNFNQQTRKNMQDPNGDYLWLFSGSR